MQSNEKNEQPVKRERPNRTPLKMSGRNVTTVSGKEKGFHYHIFNDTGDRVEQMKERGYEVVTHEVSVGDRRAASSKKVGSPVVLNVGAGTKGVLMRIPQDWYDEDQKEKLRMADSMEEAITGKRNPQTGELSGDYGSVSISK